MSLGLCQSAAKRKGKGEKYNTKQKKNKKPKKLMKVTKIGFLGVRFFFFWFLFFGLLVFWFVVGFLKGWQDNTKVKDLDLTLCQFSHFRGCKLAFG